MTESATYSQVITTEIIGHNAVSAVKWENNLKKINKYILYTNIAISMTFVCIVTVLCKSQNLSCLYILLQVARFSYVFLSHFSRLFKEALKSAYEQ